MEKNLKRFLKNVSYTFTSNGISFVVNALVVLIIPKLIGISEYGYFQLYLLLATYTLYFHFGWCDGIYLRYVGKDYNELDKKLFSSQFQGICILASILVSNFLFAIFVFIHDTNKRWIYCCIAIAVFVVIPKTYTSVLMQATNRMREYSQIIIIEKVVYTLLLIVMLICKVRDFKILILADILGKISALGLGIYFCIDIIITRFKWTYKYIKEALINSKVGMFLLISNVASIFITGVVQFFIENKWNIETFSKVSLTFNMSKMLLVVITAMSIVMVPILKHLDNKKLAVLYKKIRAVLMIVLSGMLLFYYPFKLIMMLWLPQYKESLMYMALLFPMCLFESKTSLLINTYLKAMRKEKILCVVNVLTVVLSVIVSYSIVFLIGNLNLAILCIPYLLTFRCVALEYYIEKKLGIQLMKDAMIEIGITTCFILFSWYLDSWIGVMAYFCIYIVYVIYNIDNLKWMIHIIKYIYNKK